MEGKPTPQKMFGLGSALNSTIHVHAKTGWECLLSLPHVRQLCSRVSPDPDQTEVSLPVMKQ